MEQTVHEYLEDFVRLYGESKWGVSTYDSNTRLIRYYIDPLIGDVQIQAITPILVDRFYHQLKKTKAVETKHHKPRTEFITPQTIDKIQKLLRCAFQRAVIWKLIPKNPFNTAMLPKVTYRKRDIWNVETIRTALDQYSDGKLYIAMNLAFACSLRVGEILGLT